MEILAKGSILFSLKKTISPKIITILYLLGLAAMFLFAISHFVASFSLGFVEGIWGLLEIAVFGLFGFITLRIFCEAIIIYFKSHADIITDTESTITKKSLIDDVRDAIEELAQDEKRKNPPAPEQIVSTPAPKKTTRAKKPVKKPLAKKTTIKKTSEKSTK